MCVQVEAEAELLALFCGREDSDTEEVPGQRLITSPRSSLSVSFRSDFSDEERYSGFRAHYSAEGELHSVRCPLLCSAGVIIDSLLIHY